MWVCKSQTHFLRDIDTWPLGCSSESELGLWSCSIEGVGLAPRTCISPSRVPAQQTWFFSAHHVHCTRPARQPLVELSSGMTGIPKPTKACMPAHVLRAHSLHGIMSGSQDSTHSTLHSTDAPSTFSVSLTMAWHVKYRSFCSGWNDCPGLSSLIAWPKDLKAYSWPFHIMSLAEITTPSSRPFWAVRRTISASLLTFGAIGAFRGGQMGRQCLSSKQGTCEIRAMVYLGA